MGKKCENWGKNMKELNISHCSEQCIFENLKKSKKFGDPKNPPDYSSSWKQFCEIEYLNLRLTHKY